MKSKAHSKKCQETGVLEELEAEEGTVPTSSFPNSLSTSHPSPLPLTFPLSRHPHFYYCSPSSLSLPPSFPSMSSLLVC